MHAAASDATPRASARVFISYARKDEAHVAQLERGLSVLKRQGLVSVWHFRKLEAGDNWKDGIDANLEKADIILLLVSPDFVASDYCWEFEAKRAMERHKEGTARVIPVLLRACDWEHTPLAALQCVPLQKPIANWRDRDAAWTEVAAAVRAAATRLARAPATLEAAVTVLLEWSGDRVRRTVYREGSRVAESESPRTNELFSDLFGSSAQWHTLTLQLFGFHASPADVRLDVRIVAREALARWWNWWGLVGPDGERFVDRGWTFVVGRDTRPDRAVRIESPLRGVMVAIEAPEAEMHRQDVSDKLAAIWPSQGRAQALTAVRNVSELAPIAQSAGPYQWFLYVYGLVSTAWLQSLATALRSLPPAGFIFINAVGAWPSLPLGLSAPSAPMVVVRWHAGTAAPEDAAAHGRAQFLAFLGDLGVEGRPATHAVANRLRERRGTWTLLQEAETFGILPKGPAAPWRMVRQRLDREDQRRRAAEALKGWLGRALPVASLVVVGSQSDVPGDFAGQLWDQVERDPTIRVPTRVRHLTGLRWQAGFTPSLGDQLRYVFGAEARHGSLGAALHRFTAGTAGRQILVVDAGPFRASTLNDAVDMTRAWIDTFARTWVDEVPAGWLVVGVLLVELEQFGRPEADRLSTAVWPTPHPFELLPPLTGLSHQDLNKAFDALAPMCDNHVRTDLVPLLWERTRGEYAALWPLLERGEREGWGELLSLLRRG